MEWSVMLCVEEVDSFSVLCFVVLRCVVLYTIGFK